MINMTINRDYIKETPISLARHARTTEETGNSIFAFL
jgi:hypothetical protein